MMSRITMMSDRLIISASNRSLSVRVGSKGERMRVAIPPGIDPACLDDFTAQALAVLAGVPFADKMLRHRLPEDVQAALRVLADYVMESERPHG